MSTRCSWLDPGKVNWEGPKERARRTHWIGGGAKILMEIWQRGLCGGTSSADLRIALENGDIDTGSRKNDGGRQSVGAGADDCRVGHSLSDSMTERWRIQASSLLYRLLSIKVLSCSSLFRAIGANPPLGLQRTASCNDSFAEP